MTIITLVLTKNNNMKYFLMICLLAMACNSTTATNTDSAEVPLTKITGGYFLRNDVILEDKLSCMVATTQAMLDANFGYGAVMGEQATPPDFNTDIVFAIVAQTTDVITELAFEKAVLTDGDLKVTCTVKESEEQGYSSTPVALVTVKRDTAIKTVSFYNGDELIRKVEL